jgi:hypothetical protein
MAQRQLNERTELNVVAPDDRKAEMWQTGAQIADFGLKLKAKQDQANMNQFAAQAQLDIQKATQDWRVQNEGQPMDDKAVGALQQSYDSILNQYDNKIGFMSRGDWAAVKQKIKINYQEDNQTWGFKQSVKNAQDSVNSSIKINLDLAQQYGVKGDYEAFKRHYAETATGLNAFATDVIGPETHKELLADYKSDSVKSFMMGQATSDPDRALMMLEDKEVQSNIGRAEDLQTVKNFALKQKKVIKEGLEISQIGNGIALMKEFSQRAPTAEDIPRIAKMGSEGKISETLAQASIRYITSPESIDDYEDKGVVKYLDAIFDSKDQKSIEGAVTQILEGGATGSGSPETVARMVMVASNRAEQLDVKNGQGVKPESKQGFFDGAYKSVKNWIQTAKLNDQKEQMVMKDFLEAMSKATPDTDPRAVYNDVVTRANIRNHPEVAQYKTPPTMVYSQDDGLYSIFTPVNDATVYPDKLHNRKTGEIQTNPNREISNK